MKKISRRSFLKASAVLGSAAALTACGGSSASTSTAPAASGSTAAAPSGDTIKIGTIYAMSGGNAAIGENILRGIWEHYCRYPEKLPDDFRGIMERDGLERAVTDYVSGMTDDYAIYQYGEIFIPMAWSVK